MRASMDCPQFEQTYATFASSKPDRPARRFQQGERARFDEHADSTRGAEHAALHGITEKQTGQARTEIERGSHRDQALAAAKRLDTKIAKHVTDVVRPSRIQPKAQLGARRRALDANGVCGAVA